MAWAALSNGVAHPVRAVGGATLHLHFPRQHLLRRVLVVAVSHRLLSIGLVAAHRRPPATRGECQDPSWPRPCPAVCRHRLRHGGESCSLDVAELGLQTLQRTAELLGLSVRQVQRIELEALERGLEILKG